MKTLKLLTLTALIATLGMSTLQAQERMHEQKAPTLQQHAKDNKKSNDLKKNKASKKYKKSHGSKKYKTLKKHQHKKHKPVLAHKPLPIK